MEHHNTNYKIYKTIILSFVLNESDTWSLALQNNGVWGQGAVENVHHSLYPS
jgi:hypothetical protein